MAFAGRMRSCSFRYKDLAEAQSSPLLPKPHINAIFENTLVSEPPLMAVSVGGRCQGWRKRMEDEVRFMHSTHCAVMVVLDGHRGEQAALFCAERLPAIIIQNAESVLACEKGITNISAVNEESDTTYAVELAVGVDPRGSARRSAFVRAFSDADVQLFEIQGGGLLYHASPRKKVTVEKVIVEKGGNSKENKSCDNSGNNSPSYKDCNDVENTPPNHFGTFIPSEVLGKAGDGGYCMTSPPPSSGATAIAVMVDAEYITVGSLGDCRAFLVERRADDPEALSKNGALPTGVRIREVSVVHRLSNANESLRLVQQFGPGVVFNGRVLGCLMVSRAFGDFDVKFNMVSPRRPTNFPTTSLCVVPPHDALQRHQSSDDEEPWTSSLVVSNIPQTCVWKRGVIPQAPPDGWGTKDVVPYDLIVAGSDGVWELQEITSIVGRVDEALQPLLHSGTLGYNNDMGGVAKEKFISAIEAVLQKAIAESLRKGVASSCSSLAAVPGTDNMSLALMLLLR